VVNEVADLDVPAPVHLVTDDEPALRQLPQMHVDVDVLVREHVGLDSARAVLHPALAVCTTPEAGEEQASVGVEVG
jgi:hypothetical protein